MKESEHIRRDVVLLCFTTTVFVFLFNKKVLDYTNILFAFFPEVMS